MTSATSCRGPLARTAVAVATAVLLLPAGVADGRPAHPPRSAARAGSVTVADMAFSPATVSTTLGGPVTWSFPEAVVHTTTSDRGFWDSGTRSGGATYTRTFTSAGTFGYHCTIHSMMRGKVAVPVAVRGTPSRGYRLTWATVKGSAGLAYDVQTRRGAGRWVPLRSATTGTHARLDPAKAGAYAVRARTTKGGSRSGWSPTVTVIIS